MAIDDMFGNPATGEVFGKDDLEVKEYLGKALVEDLWNLRATQVYEARRLAQAGGRGVKVAIIDTGINYNHPQLKGSCSPIRGINLSGGSENDFMDTDGHGTFVAGIIAGRDFGIAPEAEIYAVRISKEGIGDPNTLRDAIYWCINNKIDIASISSGTPRYREDIRSACVRANKRGLIIVAAAGNNSTGAFFPASYDREVISVGAVDSAYKHCIFSNIWPTTDLVAPGKRIFSAHSNKKGEEKYMLSDGTSAAAPHITGILALGLSLLKREAKEIEQQRLEEILKDTTLSYLKRQRKKEAFSLTDVYSQKYDPRKRYIKRNKATIEAIYGVGLVQAKDFIKGLMKIAKIKRKA